MTREDRTALKGLAVIALALVVTGGGPFSQLWNIARADAHAVKVAKQLAGHPEFQDIRAGNTTSRGGALAISGHLRNVEQLERLKALVAQTRPPVKVVYYVRVGNRQPRPSNGS